MTNIHKQYFPWRTVCACLVWASMHLRFGSGCLCVLCSIVEKYRPTKQSVALSREIECPRSWLNTHRYVQHKHLTKEVVLSHEPEGCNFSWDYAHKHGSNIQKMRLEKVREASCLLRLSYGGRCSRIPCWKTVRAMCSKCVTAGGENTVCWSVWHLNTDMFKQRRKTRKGF